MLTYVFRAVYKKCVLGLHFSVQHPTNHWLSEEKKLAFSFNSSLVHLVFIVPSSWFPGGPSWACDCKGSRCKGTFCMRQMCPNFSPTFGQNLSPFDSISSNVFHISLPPFKATLEAKQTAVLWSKVASRLHAWGSREKREVLCSSACKASRALERPSQKESYLPQQSGLSAPEARHCLGKLKKSNCHLNWRGGKKWEGATYFSRCRNPCLLSPGRHDLTIIKIMQSM